MGEFLAYNSRWRVALIFLGAVVFVALGLWMVGTFGEVLSSPRYPAPVAIGIGWLAILFFGLCAVAAVKKFFDGTVQLQINSSGIRWSQWSDDLIPWSEIADVTTWSHRGQKVIVLHLKNPERFPGRGLAAMLSTTGRAMIGGDISISLGGTDRTYVDAMSAIEHFRSVKA